MDDSEVLYSREGCEMGIWDILGISVTVFLLGINVGFWLDDRKARRDAARFKSRTTFHHPV